MRRIPHPSRAIDALHTQSLLLPRSCSRSFPLCVHWNNTSAAFSTSRPRPFLLPGKQDKKKHQQFVRRWQKRLLGDSEPIGAHVDPYDPTSPVRIAPEEQGEYEEILEDDRPGTAFQGSGGSVYYEPATEDTEDSRLPRIGGDQWIEHKLEQDAAKEFEKLTLRTYTPLSLDMANQIENLTGTPYTLRDENLMMAQTIHEVTGRPYTTYNFGMHTKSRTPLELRTLFSQAVVEVYALQEAGLEMDFSKFSNLGVYAPPGWIKDIKLSRASSGKTILSFPRNRKISDLIQAIQTAPEWDSISVEENVLHVEDLMTDEGSEASAPAVEEPQPTMDPNTPAFKRAAVVKMDGESRSFDFMSNRPVPRSHAAAGTKTELQTGRHEAIIQSQPSLLAAQVAELNAAASNSQNMVGELRRSFIEQRAARLAYDLKSLKSSISGHGSSPSGLPLQSLKWTQVHIDDSIKFALFKRLFQLTGRRISDPDLTAAKTLGDLYGFLCAAAKPRSASLFTTLHREGQRARERTKQQGGISKRKADLGDLLALGNVELRRAKPSETERRTTIGQEKVVQYALWERGLDSGSQARTSRQQRRKKPTIPEFGRVVSQEAATFLSK